MLNDFLTNIEEFGVLGLSLTSFGTILGYSLGSLRNNHKKQITRLINGYDGELSSQIELIQDQINELNKSTKKISEITDKANKKVDDTFKESQATEDVIIKLYQNNKEIEDLLSVIADIGVQTRVLALNASIEAERAGEAGLGFAVVAAEVNELSRQSKKSLELIETKLSNIQGELGYALGSISKTTKSAKSVDRFADDVNKSLESQEKANKLIEEKMGELAYSFFKFSSSLGATK